MFSLTFDLVLPLHHWWKHSCYTFCEHWSLCECN